MHLKRYLLTFLAKPISYLPPKRLIFPLWLYIQGSPSLILDSTCCVTLFIRFPACVSIEYYNSEGHDLHDRGQTPVVQDQTRHMTSMAVDEIPVVQDQRLATDSRCSRRRCAPAQSLGGRAVRDVALRAFFLRSFSVGKVFTCS